MSAKDEKTVRVMTSKKRRAVFILLCLIILTITAALGYYIFQVTEIKVSGNSMFSAEEIVTLSGIELGTNIFMINNKKVAEAISGEPYLVLDRVELQLPSTIVLNVRERKAAGVVESGGSYALIDYTGVVLRVVNEKPVDLITITGIENENAKQGKTIDGMDEYKSFCLNKLMISLEEYDSLDITAIDISMPVAIMLETKPGIKIKLGLIDNLADSLVLAKNFLPRLISEGKKSGTLDVSGNSASYIP